MTVSSLFLLCYNRPKSKVRSTVEKIGFELVGYEKWRIIDANDLVRCGWRGLAV